MSQTPDDTREPLVSREALSYVVSQQTFTSWTGVTVNRVAYGAVELAMPFRREDMAQHHGFLHGAMIGFLVDNVCAYTAATVVGDVLTAQYSVNFLRPGIGETFIARGRMVSRSRRQVVVRADIFAVKDGAEKLIAIGDSVVMPAGERNEVRDLK
ncbi:PaaI family thioesterase [Aquisalinus flavus]|uniref:Phenylacetic acid degradation protein n=1 Tax=Aquisalinus flavus TaxID=1526572 RepID=A0A8J2V1C2_9PROT|nr:PaaI family thioesterase [Aquisalinus flavus]MBD0426838.1 PaaI family thioesterase [Aquisalinus flavus]GGC96395.1 phenylacetic acid degradation protein [Aquisalinus flavus]